MSEVSWFVRLIRLTLNQASGHDIMYNYWGKQTEMSSTLRCFTELWPKLLRRKKDFILFFDFHINEEVFSSCQKTVNTASRVLTNHNLSALSKVLCYLVRVALRVNDQSSDFKTSCTAGPFVSLFDCNSFERKQLKQVCLDCEPLACLSSHDEKTHKI